MTQIDYDKYGATEWELTTVYEDEILLFYEHISPRWNGEMLSDYTFCHSSCNFVGDIRYIFNDIVNDMKYKNYYIINTIKSDDHREISVEVRIHFI